MTSDDGSDNREGSTGRFRKGLTGNPRGRPKKSNSVGAAITSALNEKVSVTENGRRKRVTKLTATAKNATNKSASGDRAFTKLVLDLAQKAEETQVAAKPTNPELSLSDEAIVDRLIARLRLIDRERNDGHDDD